MTAAQRVGWLVASAALAIVGWKALQAGAQIAEHFSGRKLGGVLEGDWFFLVGLLVLAFAWALAIRTGAWAISGKRKRRRLAQESEVNAH